MDAERAELMATLADDGVKLNKRTAEAMSVQQLRAMISLMRPNTSVTLEGWHEVWHATHQPGTLPGFLNWVAENGYRLVQGDPMPPVDEESAWMALAGTEETPEEPTGDRIEWTEERPGVWKTATPEDGARLDSVIDDALANLGTSLADLRKAEGENGNA
ncbi:hypothetical protein HOS59_gp27 [Streptomyces phage Rowa]|uniref:Uncharacterized protein n=1 Tax=Streptomyces phage Rowa TaxID=2059883 RepID=A0A2H5BLX8_9CAUD|nr:hypothetical protein HOS59_gp27 [Streptomyces phage Rowa]AUG87291.1 hypothetical protein SEA_ROWA_27 [Streptomyces phage Rowa]